MVTQNRENGDVERFILAQAISGWILLQAKNQGRTDTNRPMC
jgi:hypothetical protein